MDSLISTTKLWIFILWKKLFQLLYPILSAECFEDFALKVVLFPSFKNFKHIILWIFIYTMYILYIIDGFFHQYIDTYYLPMPRSSLGPLRDEIHFLVGTIVLEALIVRSNIFYTKLRSGKNCTSWFKVFLRTSKDEHPKLFQVLKFSLDQLYLGIMLILIFNEMFKISFERCTFLDSLVTMAWLITSIFSVRYTIIELLLIYVITFCCYMHLNNYRSD